MVSEASTSSGILQGQGRTTDTPNRCTQCNARLGEHPRNLVVCIDGTGNRSTSNKTNVGKLFEMVDLDSATPSQQANYWPGIGAQPESKKAVLRDTVDVAFAPTLENNVKGAYRWLAQEYEKGNQIYLFGFSRGAYQVRILAAMIHEVGLTKELTDTRVNNAYEYYKSSYSGGQEAKKTARRFKKSYCWQHMRVHFVGVWDTVSSVGFLPQDIPLSRSSSAEHACHFRHALALDELRVKFMPEYFHEINSLADLKHTNTSPDDRKATSPTNELGGVSDGNASDPSADKKKGSNIKEVWFAGSHSDVGGKNKTGRYHHPGNVSLLWMRREAAASGLVLKPTDIVWLPHDLDFGITNSMTHAWRALECVPAMHQISYCGLGEKGMGFHQQQPRCIIPGQKIHASILYAHAYKPKATLGEGFDEPIILPGFEDAMLGGGIWETGLFDASAAEPLINSLGMREGVAPINLDKLLFILRFREGRQSVKGVPGWQGKFMKLMNDKGCATVVRLVAIVAYHEASCDPEACPNSCVLLSTGISKDILADAKKCLKDIMDHHKHRDGPRVIGLLRLLTKHQIFRKRILTEDILETLVDSFDGVIRAAEKQFVLLAMDGLNCLLQCVDMRLTIVEKLRSNPPGDAMSRLSRMLEVKDPLHLTAALRMVSILVRFPQGRAACSEIESKIKQLASKNERLIGPLAAQLYLTLYNPNDQCQLDIRNAHVRTNLASALLCLARQPDLEEVFNVFGFCATDLAAQHKKLIGELISVVEKGKNVRERTAATVTLLKLCESATIREHYREIKLLDNLVSQLRHKDSALLAAILLVTCLGHADLEYIKDDKRLPQYIITMIKDDYFDNAVGQFGGFRVFRELIQHADLRKEVTRHNVIKILTDKLGTSGEKAMRCGLTCLDTFRSCDPGGQWFSKLFQKGFEYLQAAAWKNQEAGANILCALAQTEYGVETISARIPEILEMLLPESHLLIRRPNFPQTPGNLTSSDNPDDAQKKDTITVSTAKSPPWMRGPAYALRILAQNAILRDRIFKTQQYGYVKELHQNGVLVEKNDTAVWRLRLKTPHRDEMIHELDEMIAAVELD